MYLSRLILNPRSRQVRNELADPYEMHRTVMQAFPDELPSDERVLFRVEVQPRTGIPTLLVQSRYRPDWSRITDSSKDYLLNGEVLLPGLDNPAVKFVNLRLQVGQRLVFRLRANPTVKKKREGKKQGRRVGLYREEEQLAWLQRKLESAGARLLQARVGNKAEPRGKLFAERNPKNRMKFLAVQFEGILEVQDPEKLLAAIRAGIGSGKGLGFGLLSLAPAR